MRRVGIGWLSYGHGGWGMGSIECCEMCKPDDSQTCTSGANNTLYVNFLKIRLEGKPENEHVWVGVSVHIYVSISYIIIFYINT